MPKDVRCLITSLIILQNDLTRKRRVKNKSWQWKCAKNATPVCYAVCTECIWIEQKRSLQKIMYCFIFRFREHTHSHTHMMYASSKFSWSLGRIPPTVERRKKNAVFEWLREIEKWKRKTLCTKHWKPVVSRSSQLPKKKWRKKNEENCNERRNRCRWHGEVSAGECSQGIMCYSITNPPSTTNSLHP